MQVSTFQIVRNQSINQQNDEVTANGRLEVTESLNKCFIFSFLWGLKGDFHVDRYVDEQGFVCVYVCVRITAKN